MKNIPIIGELEQAVLNYLWKHQEGSVKLVHSAIGKKRKISSNTIQSTLERLQKKGLLSREKVSYAYVYRPAVERNELIGQWLNEMIDSFSAGKSEIMISAFADLSKSIDSESLEKLEELIKKVEKKNA